MSRIVEIKLRVFSSLYSKTIGLIGKKNIKPVFFTTRFGIHTFGVKEPIDVVILDNKHKVRKIKTTLTPNRIFFWNPQFNRVLELPKEYVKNKKIKLGDTIIISNLN